MNQHQRNYVQACALMQALQEDFRTRTLPIDLRLERGEITEDEWAQRYNEVEEALGIPEVRQLRLEARVALIAWGRVRVEALWPLFAAQFPQGSEELMRRVFDSPRAQDRLADLIMRLGGDC